MRARETGIKRDKILIVGGLGVSLLLFRGDLIKSWLKKGYAVTAAAPGREMENQLAGLGVEYRDIPLKRTGLSPFRDLVLLSTLRRLIKQVKPDYILYYTIKPVIYGSLAAYFNKQARVFSIITGLGYVFTKSSWKNLVLKKLVAWLYRVALNRNERVFFQNPDDSKTFRDLNIVDTEKVIQINGSGVNIDYYRPAPLPNELASFLLIARLLKEKGIMEFVQAARIVKRRYPEAKFAMIGWQFEENPSAIRQEQVDLWQSEGIVDIYDETDDVRPFIADTAVYVLPSYREGTPRTVLEAMAMGRPIITTDVPGCRETVEDGVNGFLVPVKNSEALAEAMERFVLQPDLIARMGETSRKIAEEKYDVRKVNRVINETMGLAQGQT